ncbi:Alginate lyase [Catalinimonas alkaloidigena]|uniref:Alginate lyase n=2 Tax=Catalinimonas alkaloidigena TaxID=1075417 RepID=A0A1G9NIM2_9BACT|nr:Alginate lyase [Catalinimonas alkaloidigena]
MGLARCGPARQETTPLRQTIVATLREPTLQEADWALRQEPVTVTAKTSERSAGSIHDFYSEGDYWWPDSAHPEGPYVRRDGMTNPDNFVAHRLAMIRLSRIVGALASAYRLTGEGKYARHAMRHLRAWFVEADTRMNPSLAFAQAIKGRVTGRGIGIIDTIHLMEVAQGLRVLEGAPGVAPAQVAYIRQWFADYLRWLTTHPYGQDELNTKNNHSTCWVMQVAAFARLTENDSILAFCRERYKTVLLPGQMAADGSFPLELERTKPYGYSLFNLDAMTTLCQILSDAEHDLWQYQTPDGRSIRDGIAFMYPYVDDKAAWPYAEDVMYWNEWPVAHPFLVFGAVAFDEAAWLATWERLDHTPDVEEVLRNLPIRHPLLWLDEV